jgi:diguanylate cyclase (GGDEF)-like protein
MSATRDASRTTMARFEPPPEATPLETTSAWTFWAFVTLSAIACTVALHDGAYWPSPIPVVSIVALALLVAVVSPFGTFQTVEGLAEYASLAMPIGFAMLLVLGWRDFTIAIALGEICNFVSERSRKKNPTMWYIRTYNVCMQIVAGAFAETVLRMVRPIAHASPGGAWLSFAPALTLVLAALVWKLCDNVATTVLITLAAGRPLTSARVSVRVFFSQFALFLIAIPFARLWSDNIWVSLFALAPLGVAYRLLGLPELEYRATTDERTGLTNAGAFDRIVRSAVASAESGEKSLVLLAIDIDHFKSVNDTFGHLAGDGVIARFAAILTEIARREDVAARTGGEEFALLMRDADRTAALAFAERLRARVETETFDLGSFDAPITVTASIGVAIYPEDGATPLALFAAADAALYRAKMSGRNAVRAAERIVA